MIDRLLKIPEQDVCKVDSKSNEVYRMLGKAAETEKFINQYAEMFPGNPYAS